jgi:hypothetical protein
VDETTATAPRAATGPDVFACIANVSAKLAQTGIAKDRKNDTQGFQFRGIDDIYNALAPIMAENRLVIIPRIISRDVVERQTARGGTLLYVTLAAEFQFTSANDGSYTIVRTYGEAMDSGDKATNKAMSAAYKYAALMTFAIPTEGDNDADATHPEPTVAKPPTGFDDWFADMVATADSGVAALKEAWAGSDEKLRDYAEKFRAAEWTVAKKKSAAADKAKKAAQQ